MWGLILAIAAASWLGLGVQGIHLASPGSESAPKVVRQHLSRHHVEDPVARDRRRFLHKRQNESSVEVPLRNDLFLYYMNISVGTPPQDFEVHLDTGSSDLWLNVPDSQICSLPLAPCTTGTYQPNSSSTYEYVNSLFSILYVDRSRSQGDYARDTVRLTDGNITLPAQQFGIGYNSSTPDAIMGIGYPTNEVQVAQGGGMYDNIPVTMVKEGVINTLAYSLWLNNIYADGGDILFGGVNTAKYTGDLVSLPIIPQGSVYREFTINSSSIGLSSGAADEFSGTNLTVHLDSGASFCYLPEDVTQRIYDHVGAIYDSRQGINVVDCSVANRTETVDFAFNNITIKVPMSELVVPYANFGASELCVLGVLPTITSSRGREYLILGDTFLRSAYVVYDMEHHEISLAQTVFGVEEQDSDIVEIASNGGEMPSGAGNGTSIGNFTVPGGSSTKGNGNASGGGSNNGNGNSRGSGDTEGAASKVGGDSRIACALALTACIAWLW